MGGQTIKGIQPFEREVFRFCEVIQKTYKCEWVRDKQGLDVGKTPNRL